MAAPHYKKLGLGVMLESNAKQIELICNRRGYLKKNTNKKITQRKSLSDLKMEIAGPVCERLVNEIIK